MEMEDKTVDGETAEEKTEEEWPEEFLCTDGEKESVHMQ